MTAYIITTGYNASKPSKAAADVLCRAVHLVQESTGKLFAEVLRIDPLVDREILRECVDAYRMPVDDLTLQVSYDESGSPTVRQTASGGGVYRAVKEAVRRAVCRMIMEHCHSFGVEVSINVV